MSLYWLVLVAGALQVALCDGQGICGDALQKTKVRPFMTDLLDLMQGNWTVIAYWENQNKSYFLNTECLYYRQELNPQPSYLNLTEIQRLNNGTRTETPQLLNFKNSNYVYYYSNKEDSNALVSEERLLNYDLTAPEEKDRFLIVYACFQDLNNQTWKRFWTLTNRTDRYEERPAINLAMDRALKKVGLNRGLTKSLWNEECAEQEWGKSTIDAPEFSSESPETFSNSEEPSE